MASVFIVLSRLTDPLPLSLSIKYGLSGSISEFNVVGRTDSVVKPELLYGCTVSLYR